MAYGVCPLSSPLCLVGLPRLAVVACPSRRHKRAETFLSIVGRDDVNNDNHDDGETVLRWGYEIGPLRRALRQSLSFDTRFSEMMA